MPDETCSSGFTYVGENSISNKYWNHESQMFLFSCFIDDILMI